MKRIFSIDGFANAGVLTAVYVSIWGAMALLPYDMFALSPVQRLYGTVAPEWVWGSFALTFGLCQLAGLVARRYALASVGAAGLLGFFLFGAALMFQGEPRSPGGYWYALYGLWQFNLLWRLAQETPRLFAAADSRTGRPEPTEAGTGAADGDNP